MTLIQIITARERGVSNDLLDADLWAVRLQLLLEADIEAAEEGAELETLSNGEAIWHASIEPTTSSIYSKSTLVEFSQPAEGGPPLS